MKAIDRYHKIRDECIKKLGGCCVVCGSRHRLQFDHKDPSSRKFKIGKLLNYKLEELEEEIKKCQLLCIRCHIKKSKEEGSLGKNRVVGSKNKKAVLNEDQVAAIRVKLKNKEKMSDLCLFYGVSYETIKFIKYGKTWKHVIIE